MKKIFILGLFIGIISISFSQEYLPLPETNSKWINTYSYLIPDPYPHFEIINFVNYCTPGVDTTINGFSYFIIDTCDGGYKGAFRNENGKVWFVPRNSQNEFLLYDFSAQAGDTILNVYIEGFSGFFELHDLYVEPDAVDSILINGNYRKKIHFDAGDWIEGIGNSQGLFLEPWPNISDYMVDLYCMSTNDTTLFPGYFVGDCELPVGVKEMENSNLLLSIYPNPCINEFYMELMKSNRDDLNNIIVVNSFGQKISPAFKIENNTIRIEMESYPPGIYFIRFSNNEKVFVRKLIKE